MEEVRLEVRLRKTKAREPVVLTKAFICKAFAGRRDGFADDSGADGA